jgi:hypothetical protein
MPNNALTISCEWTQIMGESKHSLTWLKPASIHLVIYFRSRLHGTTEGSEFRQRAKLIAAYIKSINLRPYYQIVAIVEGVLTGARPASTLVVASEPIRSVIDGDWFTFCYVA